MGLLWLVYFFVVILTKEETDWYDYGWIVVFTTYLITYFYQKYNKYLTIENGIIKVNSPFGKQLKLSEIKEIKTFAGDYILKTAEKELKINTQIIDPKLLAEFNSELKKLDVEWI